MITQLRLTGSGYLSVGRNKQGVLNCSVVQGGSLLAEGSHPVGCLAQRGVRFTRLWTDNGVLKIDWEAAPLDTFPLLTRHSPVWQVLCTKFWARSHKYKAVFGPDLAACTAMIRANVAVATEAAWRVLASTHDWQLVWIGPEPK